MTTPLIEDNPCRNEAASKAIADVDGKVRLLIVDDTPAIHDDFRKSLLSAESPALDQAEEALFGDAGTRRQPRDCFELDSAYQGQEGLELVRQARAKARPYAVAFVDIRMPPGWDGIETIQRLWEVDPELQVVICTAYSDYSWSDIVRRLGQSDSLIILKKPFDTVEVLQLAHALSRKWLLTCQSRRRTADLDAMVNRRTVDLREEVSHRRRAEDLLREANGKLEALFRASPLAIVVSDIEGRVQMWNEAAEKTFGWSEREVLDGLHPFVPKAQREAINQAWSRVVSGGQIRAQELPQWTRKDGSLVDLLWSCAPLRDPQGETKGVVAVYADLTEKKQLELRLLRAQRLESIGQLAGGVAHDLNNILAPILLCFPLLFEEVSSKKGVTMLNAMQASARRGAEIVRQLLTFARGMAGKRVIFQPQHLLREATSILRETLPKSIRLETSIPAELWSLLADPNQLHQVLINLALNARDAMAQGGTLKLSMENVRLQEVDLQATPDLEAGPYVLLRVADTGTGIAPEIAGHLFEPFFTTKGLERGTGLGLSTVRGIVKSHSGFVDFSSKVGQGTEFRVYLPAQMTPEPATVHEANEPPPRGQGETILIVDDEDAVCAVAQRTLEVFGYRTLTASDGAVALALYREKGPQIDMVLADMNMPSMDGKEMIKAIREINSRAKVVVATGGVSAYDLRMGAELGVQAILKKPFETLLLLRTLRNVLKNEAAPANSKSRSAAF